jgi:hypothetical protein
LTHFRDRIVRCVSILGVLSGTCLACALAIHYFYGLHGAATLWPYESVVGQDVAILRTAAIGTLASSWAIWFGARMARNFRISALWAALGTLITLVVYGILGCGGVLGGDSKIAIWNAVTDFIFPTTFFAEYNFLTFTFEVAPTTAIAEAILLFFFSGGIFSAARKVRLVSA